jgi:hypothetical protein
MLSTSEAGAILAAGLPMDRGASEMTVEFGPTGYFVAPPVSRRAGRAMRSASGPYHGLRARFAGQPVSSLLVAGAIAIGAAFVTMDRLLAGIAWWAAAAVIAQSFRVGNAFKQRCEEIARETNEVRAPIPPGLGVAEFVDRSPAVAEPADSIQAPERRELIRALDSLRQHRRLERHSPGCGRSRTVQPCGHEARLGTQPADRLRSGVDPRGDVVVAPAKIRAALK